MQGSSIFKRSYCVEKYNLIYVLNDCAGSWVVGEQEKKEGDQQEVASIIEMKYEWRRVFVKHISDKVLPSELRSACLMHNKANLLPRGCGEGKCSAYCRAPRRTGS